MKHITLKNIFTSVIASSLLMASAQANDADLAQELTNPIADLMTIPIQMTYDQNIGANDKGYKIQTNIQPVIPFDVSEDWNLLTRTIIPVIKQKDIGRNTGSQFGLGDTSMSFFFSPKKSTGVIWGAGPIAVLPTATNGLLGADKWGVGPAGIVLAMMGQWTVGGLANHVWIINSDNDARSTFIQPFAAYTWKSAWTLSLQSESTYNWVAKEWAVPVNATVSKLVRFGNLPVSLQAGTGYWAKSATNGAEGVRFRLQANIVLPKF